MTTEFASSARSRRIEEHSPRLTVVPPAPRPDMGGQAGSPTVLWLAYGHIYVSRAGLGLNVWTLKH